MNCFGLPLVVVVCGLQILTSCGSESEFSQSSRSFLPFIVQELGTHGKGLAIQKKLLNEEFLLRTNVLAGGSTVSFRGLKSRVVRFQKFGHELYLVESSDEYQLHDEFTQAFILARFPILSESEDSILFDFNKGFNKLYEQQDWDFVHNGELATEESLEASELSLSFLKSISQDEDGLEITQSAQKKEEGKNVPVEIRYHLTRYTPNPNFQPLASEEQKHFGFFKIHALRAGKDVKAWVAKFDSSKPIVFYMTANTPEEYRQAVTEGVLYWNKAFGRNVLRAAVAPQGITAPNYKMNIIQWVDWDDAHFAYADAQMDPRTGQVLNSQIYIPSAFTAGTKRQAAALLDKMQGASQGNAFSSHSFMEQTQLHRVLQGKSLKEHRTSPRGHCFHEDVTDTMFELGAMLAHGATDEQMARLANDSLRKTIAHEVGHVLGLRHNFAGNLAANVTTTERQLVFQRYLEGAGDNGTVVTSSIMDYLPLRESLIAGAQLKSGDRANLHDEQAIRSLYLGANYVPAELPLFCTDEELGRYVDCNRFMAGDNAFAHAEQSAKDFFHALPFVLSNYLVTQLRRSELGIHEPLGRLTMPNPYLLASRVLRERWPALASVIQGSQHLSIARHPAAALMSVEERGQIHAIKTASELEKFGGWKKALAPLAPDFVEKATKKTQEILETQNKDVNEGHFRDLQKEQLEKTIANFYRHFVQAYNELSVVQFALLPNISDVPLNRHGETLADEFVQYLALQVKSVLLATEGEDIVRGVYPLELSVPRNEALAKLDHSILKFQTEDFVSLEASKEKVKEVIESILAKDFASTAQPSAHSEDKKAESDDADEKGDGDKEGAREKKEDAQQTLHLLIPVDFKLKRFKYSPEIRLIATMILSQTAERRAMTVRERGFLSMAVKASLSQDFYGIDAERLPMILQPRAISKWVIDNERVLQGLNGVKKEGGSN